MYLDPVPSSCRLRSGYRLRYCPLRLCKDCMFVLSHGRCRLLLASSGDSNAEGSTSHDRQTWTP